MFKTENKTVFSIATIFAFRMLGLFMILPVFTVYAHELKHATPLLIGLCLGIYGLTQGLLQIPFGLLSDKLGRKPIITTGLILFAIGSVIAACSTSIYGVLIGRGLQGAGAIGSTLMALVTDLTRYEKRTKAMAMIGMIIGVSFMFAMLFGPILSAMVGVNGIFWLTALLALIGIFILHFIVPDAKQLISHRETQTIPRLFISILKNKELLRLDFGIFIQHAILTMTFICIPLLLNEFPSMPISKQWQFYFPILIFSFISMLPAMIMAEKKRKIKVVFSSAIALVALSQLALWQFSNTHLWQVAVCLYFFFTGFNLLEANLPSLVSKISPAGSKGTAMGIYSSAQFLGIFFGGMFGGYLYHHHGINSLFLAAGVMAFLWFFVAITMKRPRYLSTETISVGQLDQEAARILMDKLKSIAGVADVVVSSAEGIAYLKVDRLVLNHDELQTYIK